jgi:hypothetical protein
VSISNDGTTMRRRGVTRRGALAAAAGGVSLTGLGLAIRAKRASAQIAVGSGGGIAGGGLIEGPDAAVQFSLFATRLPLGEGEDEFIVSGKVLLADPLQEWRMESVEVTEYGPVDGEDENLRELRGTMLVTTADGEAEYPFILRAVDVGGPADGTDTLALSVGGALEGTKGESDDFSYELSGAVSAGDIALVEIALEENEEE